MALPAPKGQFDVERRVPVGFRLLNPHGLPAFIVGATTKTVRIGLQRNASLHVDLGGRFAEIRLTTPKMGA